MGHGWGISLPNQWRGDRNGGAFKSYWKSADERLSSTQQERFWLGARRSAEAGNRRAKGGTMNIRSSITRQVLWLGERLVRAKGGKGEEGTSLVELAIALPIMLTLITGAASFSLAFFSLQQLENATANATQLLASEQALVSNPCTNVETSITTALPSWTASKFSYTVSITDSSGTVHTTTPGADGNGTTFSCASLAADMAQGEPITVTVSYTYTWLPILKFTPSSALTSTDTAMTD
jgi:Flp pilus assembly protein TadG